MGLFVVVLLTVIAMILLSAMMGWGVGMFVVLILGFLFIGLQYLIFRIFLPKDLLESDVSGNDRMPPDPFDPELDE